MTRKVREQGETMKSTADHNRWDTPTKAFAWFVLLGFTVLSAFMNAEYARRTGVAVWYHAGIPVAVLILGVFAELTYLSSVHAWARRVILAGLGSSFVAVLIASYLAVRSVTIAWNGSAPVWVNNTLAAVPDVVMVVAATVILSLRLRHHTSADSSVKPVVESRLKRLMEAATARTEAALAVPTTPQVPVPVEASRTLMEGLMESVVEPQGEVRGASAKPVVEESRPSMKLPVEEPSPSVNEALAPFMEQARRMLEDGIVTRKTPVEVAAVIAAIASGDTDNRIKSLGLASAATAAKIRSEWNQAVGPALAVV